MNSYDNSNQFKINKISGIVETKRGSKLIMEDYYVTHMVDDNISFYGIFDGHGGYTISKLLPNIVKEYIKKKEDIHINNLEILCHEIDKQLYSVIGKQDGGSTILLVICSSRNTIILHLGDSKAKCLSHDGTVIYETNDHNTSNPLELHRIYTNFPDKITYNNGIRIGGRLLNTRSIGDFQYKYYNGQYNSIKSIINTNAVIRIIPTSQISYIWMGSDGFWKIPIKLSNCWEYVQRHIRKYKASDDVTFIGLFFAF